MPRIVSNPDKMKQKSYLLTNIPRVLILVVICLLAFMISCEDWFDEDTKSFGSDVIAEGLDTPWEMAFAPNGREQSGWKR